MGAAMKCPICSEELQEEFAAKFSAVGKCGNKKCGHLFAITRPVGTGVHEHAESDVGVYAARNRILANKLVDIGLLMPGSRVLDIGSGLGHIMSAVRERLSDCRITCVEAAPKSIEYLRRNNFKVVEDFGLLSGTGPYDVIFMVEVIEHLDDPAAVLRLCHSLLTTGGGIFLTTPCGELRWGSHSTAAYETLEHVQFFTQESLCLAARNAGFDSVKFFEMREFYPGSANRAIKWVKDSLRIARNWVQGRHHFVAVVRK
jgi:2-polyprenyl-3-methyl-5-hydroxy-6-metoxy-1,4-benzoquinol methylase